MKKIVSMCLVLVISAGCVTIPPTDADRPLIEVLAEAQEVLESMRVDALAWQAARAQGDYAQVARLTVRVILQASRLAELADEAAEKIR